MFCLPRGKIVFTDIPFSGRQILNLTGNRRLVFPSKQLWNQKLFCLRYAEEGTSQQLSLWAVPIARGPSAPGSLASKGGPAADRGHHAPCLCLNTDTPTMKLMGTTHPGEESTLPNSHKGVNKRHTSNPFPTGFFLHKSTRGRAPRLPWAHHQACHGAQTLAFHFRAFPCVSPRPSHSQYWDPAPVPLLINQIG